MKNINYYVLFVLLLTAAFFSVDVLASVGTGGGLPYESPLTSIRNSVTGPIAFTLSIAGLVVVGGTLIFGGDLNGFMRGLILVVLVISLLVAAQNILATLFGRGALMVQQTGADSTTGVVMALVSLVAVLGFKKLGAKKITHQVTAQ